MLVYTALMIFPLFSTLKLALYKDVDQHQVFAGLENFRTLFGDPRWSQDFWNALGNNLVVFLRSICCCRTPSASGWRRCSAIRGCA